MSLPLDDGIFKGNIHERPGTCGICRNTTAGVYLKDVQLPEGITYRQTLLYHLLGTTGVNRQPTKFLGIGCGCYAKVHRQLAHITHHRRRGGPIDREREMRYP